MHDEEHTYFTALHVAEQTHSQHTQIPPPRPVHAADWHVYKHDVQCTSNKQCFGMELS